MAAETKIEWADATFNPWIGCTRVSPGCDHCYAAVSTPARRFGVEWGAGKARRETSEAYWRQPLRWNAMHARPHGERRFRVFCASLADVFDNEVPARWRTDLFQLIQQTPNLDWLLLTKRIGNVSQMVIDAGFASLWPLPNVWLGASICTQAEADRDILKLLCTPARVRFISVEPMLSPITINAPIFDQDGDRVLHWVICGGESGKDARPVHPDWVRSLRDQCVQSGTPFFFKQWGEFDLSYDRDRDDPDMQRCGETSRKPGQWINLAGGQGFHGDRVHYARGVGKKQAGRVLDGRTWEESPC